MTFPPLKVRLSQVCYAWSYFTYLNGENVVCLRNVVGIVGGRNDVESDISMRTSKVDLYFALNIFLNRS